MDETGYQVSTGGTSDGPLAYQAPGLPAMDMAYKIDEGYSEETRSQDEEPPMRLEANPEEMEPTSLRLAMDTIMSLTETEKSGTDTTSEQ